MGFISEFRRTRTKDLASGNRGRELWDRSFGRGTDKESSPRPQQGGGSFARSISSDAAVKRLLRALQSMAPGSPTDNRWEQTNQYFGPTFVAVDRKSRMLSQAEFQVYRRDPSAEGGKRPVREGDPAEGGRTSTPYDLVNLLKKPNRQDSFGKLMWRWSQQLNLTGQALTWMVPNRLGTPVELYPIPTAMAIPQPAVNPEYPDGFYRIQPVYPYGPFSSYPTPNSAVGAPIPAQWMLRFLWPHPLLRYEGFSPLTGLRMEIDGLTMINKSRHYKMRRGSNPDAVLNAESDEPTAPFSEPEIDRMRAEWENEHGGPENAGKFIVGTPGWKLEPWGGPSPREMDYGQSWEQLLSFILGGGFGITKPAAGMIEDSSYASLFATIKQLYLLTLQPDCVAGTTPLITRDGAGCISDYVNQQVEVWNGTRWSPVTVRKTGSDRELLRVRFSDGSFIDCTRRHRFSVNAKNNRNAWQQVMAEDLVPGMATETFAIQHTGGERLNDAYTLGVLLGDGCTRNGKAKVELYGDKIHLPISGEFSDQPCLPSRVAHVHVACGELFADKMDKLRADNEDVWWSMFSLDRQSILEFLAGWFDTDGSKGGPSSVYLCVSGRFKADMVQLLLTKCGIRSSIYRTAEAGDITNYGRRGADLWNVYVANCRDIPCHRLDTSRGKPSPRRGKYQTIRSVEVLPGRHDTYCFTELEHHKGVFNNTLTHQCDDIASDLTRHLAPFFGDDLIIEIRCKRIDDHEVKLSKLNFLKECKALTKNEAREEMEMPLAPAAWGWGGDICGDPSPAEKAQQEQQQQGDMLQGASEPTEVAGLEGEGPLAGMMGGDEVPPEMQSPGTGTLGQGSMNPRKSLGRRVKAVGEAAARRLNGTLAKSFYDVVREACRGRYN